MCNVVMDHVDYPHITVSKLPRKWGKDLMGKTVKGTGWKFDAWHIAKSSMICLLIGAVFIYKPIISIGSYYITSAIHFVFYGIVWCLLFSGGYKFLNKK